MSLQFKSVSFGYNKGENIFDRMDLTFRRGEFAAVIGPNGSGKSTLLKLGTGFLRPRQGTVLLNGQDLQILPPRERAKQLAAVFQLTGHTIPYTVEETVLMGRIAHRRWWEVYSAADHEAVRWAMEALDIARHAKKFYSDLSGGEQQRVLLAAALAQKPEIMLLDEPTSALDLGHKFHLLELLEKLAAQENIGIVMISHDLSLAGQYARRIVLLDRGKIAADGSPAEVITPENIQQTYQCRVTVQTGPGGEIAFYRQKS